MYVSLSEKQIRQEEEMTKNPLSHPEVEVTQTPSETLYQVRPVSDVSCISPHPSFRTLGNLLYYILSFSLFLLSSTYCSPMQAMLPTLPQCMIALLKILLAAAPTSKAKTDSINIMADVLPEEMP